MRHSSFEEEPGAFIAHGARRVPASPCVPCLVGLVGLLAGCAPAREPVRGDDPWQILGEMPTDASPADRDAAEDGRRPASRPAKAREDVSLLPRDGALDELEIIIPFYEGIRVPRAPAALRAAGLARFQLAYPGALSVPFIAWRFGNGPWRALHADPLDAAPCSLDVDATDEQVDIGLGLLAPGDVRELIVEGEWPDLAAALRRAWAPEAVHAPLGRDFRRIRFYVHRWVSDVDTPALRVDWTIDNLVAAMREEDPATLQFVYGLDPGSVDLGGRCLWDVDALVKARALAQANPRLSHMAWLNLRTFKTAIPRLDLRVDLPVGLEGAVRVVQGDAGEERERWSFKALDMCLASEAWQRTRLREFERLVDAGFRVVQLDEFPIPAHWHVNPCLAKGHLHVPGDAAGECREVVRFVAQLARRAAERGVRLTCEEPSALLLPCVCGYIDRQYNDSIDLYAAWKRGPGVEPIPLFSTIFGDLVTPYTDVDGPDPARRPPPGWLVTHKAVSRGHTEVER